MPPSTPFRFQFVRSPYAKLSRLRKAFTKSLCCGGPRDAGARGGEVEGADGGYKPRVGADASDDAVPRAADVVAEKTHGSDNTSVPATEARPSTPTPEPRARVLITPYPPPEPDEGFIDRLVILAPVLAGLRLLEAYREHVHPPPFRLLGLSLEHCGWELHPTHTWHDIANFIDQERRCRIRLRLFGPRTPWHNYIQLAAMRLGLLEEHLVDLILAHTHRDEPVYARSGIHRLVELRQWGLLARRLCYDKRLAAVAFIGPDEAQTRRQTYAYIARLKRTYFKRIREGMPGEFLGCKPRDGAGAAPGEGECPARAATSVTSADMGRSVTAPIAPGDKTPPSIHDHDDESESGSCVDIEDSASESTSGSDGEEDIDDDDGSDGQSGDGDSDIDGSSNDERNNVGSGDDESVE